MDGLDLRDLATRLDGRRGALTLRIHRGGQPEAALSRLEEAAKAVAGAAPDAISLAEGDGAGPPDLPALSIEDRQGVPRVHYVALPEGPEAGPFVEVVADLGRDEVDGEVARRLEGLSEPASIVVLVGPTCPHCPLAAREALALAVASPSVTVSVVDAVARPHLAAEHGARSVPFTVLDGEVTMTGVVPRASLVDAVLGRSGPEHHARMLRGHLDSGRFVAAGRQIATEEGRAPFIEAWAASTMNERMALLLTVEESVALDPRGLDPLIDDLVPLLESDDGSLRGDTADLLGRIGHGAALGALEPLRQDPLEDVAEIAEEAIEAIRESGVK